MSSSDCIEMDDSFMFNVNMRRDRCLLDENSFRYPFDEKIHNSFQKILDLKMTQALAIVKKDRPFAV